jgi:MFS family permease
MVRRVGPVAVVRAAALIAALALAAMAVAPSWPYAVIAACCAGLGIAALTPLCVAAAGRLQPGAPETVLARLNVFNYVGVLVGAGASGSLGATGHFRIAFAIPAALTMVLVTTARRLPMTEQHTYRLRRRGVSCGGPSRGVPWDGA